MSQSGIAKELAELPPRLRFAFSPLVKRAFGAGIGAALGGWVFVLTLMAYYFVKRPYPLDLLDEYFYGYKVSPTGAFVGLLWGFWAGFVAGWFFAFCRNLALAIYIFALRTKAQMNANKDFLDHI